ncbi:DUF255 domain-containing protein [Candidatus Fermentibacteria bacterium]|nr:DUF255 domain-containing protein [Candidatus Fermentibacteria bacterium]
MVLNRLADSNSPYLLDHSDNPVEWFPWGEEAWAKARNEDLPVFLSIGYSSCHWCHVMERESFRDDKIAELLNESFVCIKVDREERPDIDAVYMDAAMALRGIGGWPLTIVATPAGKPFFAATYIPRESMYGKSGLLDLLPEVARLWREERREVEDTAHRLEEVLSTATSTQPSLVPGDLYREAFREAADSFNDDTGSFGTAPLFPQANLLLFLLDHYRRTGEKRALEMVGSSLRAMRLGGLYDHVGSGFHRYCTDGRWLIPHFEKMLYVQALLLMAYLEGYRLTSEPLFQTTVEEVVSFVLDCMATGEGGFITALDADIDGEEGGFYTWTHRELQDVLTSGQMELAHELLGVRLHGNARLTSGLPKGANVIHLTRLPGPGEREELDQMLERLAEARKTRPKPSRDDKVLTDHNGLMIAALVRAGRIFDRADWIEAARRAAALILGEMADEEGRLLHSYRSGRASVEGMLEDYAFLAMGLIELYLGTTENQYLLRAEDFIRQVWEHFGSPEEGMYRTADYAEKLLCRQVPLRDGAMVSGNAVTLWDAAMLARLTNSKDWEAKADHLARKLLPRVASMPTAASFLLLAAQLQGRT